METILHFFSNNWCQINYASIILGIMLSSEHQAQCWHIHQTLKKTSICTLLSVFKLCKSALEPKRNAVTMCTNPHSLPGLLQGILVPLHPNISMYILHTVLLTFPEMLTKRNCLTMKSIFNW